MPERSIPTLFNLAPAAPVQDAWNNPSADLMSKWEKQTGLKWNIGQPQGFAPVFNENSGQWDWSHWNPGTNAWEVWNKATGTTGPAANPNKGALGNLASGYAPTAPAPAPVIPPIPGVPNAPAAPPTVPPATTPGAPPATPPLPPIGTPPASATPANSLSKSQQPWWQSQARLKSGNADLYPNFNQNTLLDLYPNFSQ